MNAMIRLLIAAAIIGIAGAMLFPKTAHGQVLMADLTAPCAATPRAAPLPVPAKVIPAQSDMPSQLKGNGTKAVIETNRYGIAAGWWVPRANGMDFYLYAASWWYLIANPGLSARLVALAVLPGGDAAMAAAIGAAYDPTLDLRDMCDVWGPLVPRLLASKPAPLAAVTHRVKPNGTAIDRPVYALTNGVRGTASVGRALVGQPCDLTKPTLASGADVWASFGPDFTAGRVALCQAVP